MPQYADRVEYKTIDFYEQNDLARKYKAPGHPTLVFLKADGSVSQVLPGVSSKEDIESALNEALQ
jgi:thioredoxin-related protein